MYLGALGVVANMEASAANHGVTFTVIAPTQATVGPPVTAVSAHTHTHTPLQLDIFLYKR